MPPATDPPYIPSVRARRLARSLRDYREQADFRVGAAAASLGWSQSKLSKIEGGRTKPSEGDVGRILDLYGVTTPDRDAILALAREAERRGWWTDYVDVLHGPYVAAEDAAARILDWAPQVVPGLLQTPEYACEIMRAGHPDDPADIERRVRARIQRQMLLTRETDPTHFHVVLDEPVLERPIGGPGIMRDQLYKLAAMARKPNVTIQVLSKASGTHAGLDGTFILLEFVEPADPPVAYVEGLHGVVYLESPRSATECKDRFERLCEQALDPDKSVALIKESAKRM